MKSNPEQQAVIDSRAALILCIAGAGSGKTATLVARIKRLIDEGADARSMVVITYTNAAARELSERLAHAMLPEGANDPDQPGVKLGYVGTLHGFLLRLLSAQHQLVGLPASLSVLDDDQKTGMLDTIRGEMNSKASLKAILPLLTRPDLIFAARGGNRSNEELVAIEYHQRLRQAGLLDFDTILFYGERLIRALDGWSYKYLFVDEIQDSADPDMNIYEAMACKNKFFVGDDSQAIYSFRGGNVQRMLQAAKGSPENGWTVFKLETNYRSGAIICFAANTLIAHNQMRYQKSTLAARALGEIKVEKCKVEANELGLVLDEIQNALALDGSKPTDFAVLARTNKIAANMADFLEARGVPVVRRKFVENPPDWKIAKLLLTVLSNPYNDLAVRHFVAERYGKKQADQVALAAAKSMRPLFQEAAMDFDGNEGELPVSLTRHNISKESRERIHDAARLLSAQGAWTINELLLFINNGELQREETGTGVTCCTIHAAKGREWATVFLVGCEQGTIPSGRKDTDIEEERRLFYVGLTRAKDKLFVSWCENRPAPFQRHVLNSFAPSQFIAEAGL